MTPEEFKRIKEAEKEHLRSLKKLKEAVRGLQRQKKLTDAIKGAVEDPMAVFDEHDALVDELSVETARNEAKLEIALENAGAEDPEAMAAQLAESEEELRKLRAKQLVEQIRQQLGGAPAQPPSAASPPAKSSSKAKQPVASAPKGKAVDSPHSPDSTEAAPLPEKTIGRMKP